MINSYFSNKHWIHNEVKGVLHKFKNKLPIEKGGISIDKVVISNKRATAENFSFVISGKGDQVVSAGSYVTLIMDGRVMMSDTDAEKMSNYAFIKKANGRVLIAGLGIGMLLHNILDKSEVKSVTVIENNSDLIDIVAPMFAHKKLTVIDADIFEWSTNGLKYDCIYFDIWSTVDTDNLSDIKKLHNKYKSKVNRDNSDWYMNSWNKERLQRTRREGNRSWPY